MNCSRCSFEATAGQKTCQNCGASLAQAPTVTPVYAVTSGYQAASYPMPPGFGAAPGPMPAATSIRGLSVAVTIVFGIVAAGQLINAISRTAGIDDLGIFAALTAGMEVALVPLFIVWFFQARRNASLWGPQRRSQAWSIAAWFVPVVFLWFPFQIAADTWRASLPATETKRIAPVVVGWWVCWLLTWFTGYHTSDQTYTHHMPQDCPSVSRRSLALPYR